MRLNGTIKTFVTRRIGEAVLEECCIPRMRSLMGTCVVWGAICHGGRSELIRFDTSQSAGKRGGITAQVYMEQITRGELKLNWTRVNNLWRPYGGAKVLEDGARIHTSLTNRDGGASQKSRYLDHPPYSPDLNPIENCWSYLKRTLALLPRLLTTIDEMYEKAQAIWEEIPQPIIDRTVDSMPRRLRAVRKARGFATRW